MPVHGEVVDFLPDAVLILDDNGTVIRANLAAAALLGYERHAVEGRGVLDFLPAFDWNLTRLPAEGASAESTPTAQRLRTTARTRDGRTFGADIHTMRLDRRFLHESVPYGSSLVISLRDATAAEDTEAALSRSLLQTEAVLRTTAEAVIGTDTDGRIDLVNPAAARLLGGKASELGGCELANRLTLLGHDGEPLDGEDSPVAQALRSGRACRLPERELRTHDGTHLTADVAVRPVSDGGEIIGAVVTLTDRRPYERLADQYDAARTRAMRHHEAALALRQRQADRAEEHARELADFLRGTLAQALHRLHSELGRLAGDSSRPLWPEASVSLDALAAGLRMTMALVNTRARPYRQEVAPVEAPRRTVFIDDVVRAGMRAATALTGPSRVQFSVHAPKFAVFVDPDDVTTALGRLIAEVSSADGDATVSGPRHVYVTALHRRGHLRIEVRGPHAGGGREHVDVVQGIAAAHGGTLLTRRAPEGTGSAYVLELPSTLQEAVAADSDEPSPAALRPTGRHRALKA
ncbi:PAS domain S-box protein [Streptomyces sp. NPDC048330]|uniref:PAS domain S-box protein n=1 Tax=Streptomyces sp. NPDC048330 TaxID=3365533 RepID=UPI0037115FF8